MPGFYPDPSVCRADGYFYMVHSTFAYFPGIPIFRSKNLADWEQIGNVLTRSSQIPLQGCGHSKGIYAPTIRYHDGIFYVITTNVSGGGNFIVTAENPAGPWSEPYYLEGAEGIDPSLFFDDDGVCYYIGQRENSVGSRYYGDCEIWIQKLDLQKMRLVGAAKPVLTGFQKNAVWPEGPHLYRRGEYYYILHAESGTAFHHSVMAARSRQVFGPYEYCPCNPILTHRHLGKDYPVTSVGHADLFDDGHGNWYAVALGCRPQKGYTLTGRETFLAKVAWEDGWPVINPGIGRLEETVTLEKNALWEESVLQNAIPEENVLPGEMPQQRSGQTAVEEDAAAVQTAGQTGRRMPDAGCLQESGQSGVECARKSGQSAAECARKSGQSGVECARRFGQSGAECVRGFGQSDDVYRFAGKVLPPAFVMLRNAVADAAHPQGRASGDIFSLTENPGKLRLYMKKETLSETASPAYVAVRQQHHTFCAETSFTAHFAADGDCAGMVLLQNDKNHIRLECAPAQTEEESVNLPLCAKTEEKSANMPLCAKMEEESVKVPLSAKAETARYMKKNAVWLVRAVRCCKGVDTILAQKTIPVFRGECAQQGDDAVLAMRVCVRKLAADLFWKTGKEWQLLASDIDIRHLSTEFAGGFTGCTVGMYASGNGTESAGCADFETFIYRW